MGTRASAGTKTRALSGPRTMAQYGARLDADCSNRLRSLPPGQFAWNKTFQRWFSS